jgi:hypothetical protein
MPQLRLASPNGLPRSGPVCALGEESADLPTSVPPGNDALHDIGSGAERVPVEDGATV